MVAEKMRVHILAKELNVPSKIIIEKCKAEGIDVVKNHMSTLSAGLHATIREWFSDGQHVTAVETSRRVDLEKVRIAPTQRRKKKTEPVAVVADVETVTEVTMVVAPPPVGDARTVQIADEEAAPTVDAGAAAAESPGLADDQVPSPVDVAVEVAVTGDAGAQAPSTTSGATDDDKAAPDEQVAASIVQQPIAPAGPQNIPAKVKLQGPRVVRYEAPDRDFSLGRRPPPRPRPPGQGPVGSPPPPPGPGAVPGAAPGAATPGRRRGRGGSARQATGRLADASERMAEYRDRDLQERRERLAGATGRRIHRRRNDQGGGGAAAAMGPKTEATVNEPVRMKEFCSATGLNFIQCFKVLRDEHGMVANVNMVLPTDTAQLLALHLGIELHVVPAKTRLDVLRDEVAARKNKNLKTRPPVVTMLGHVDHGKTSLLDAIRASRVAAGEDGGITQHIGAYHIDTDNGAVTFLDTPGHQAFTAMRARGAQLTDVVVLVVAADDGLMPQTIEAINHAKAAGVPIVVALNKIDLGDQNKLKIFGQLSQHELAPAGDWGGEIDVIETSATTGTGVAELVTHLAELSEVLELKADAAQDAVGTVIEAETKPGVGAVARVLVRQGTLRIGDFVVCGPAFGKVRAVVNDQGKQIKEAGPSMPVELWGLDEVPSAGDDLYVLDSLRRAKDIATESKHMRAERARIQSTKVKSLEDMFLQRTEGEATELNVIIKADVDGSIAALRQMLGDLPSDEVKLHFRHAGVGAVNDSDVLLAAACKGIIVAFRVEAPTQVRRLAERQGVDIRPYRVIYTACDEIKQAMEGLLEPEERIETRGSATVRELFRLGKKLGVIAGSLVTDGAMKRSHLAKVIRDGVVIREKCSFASLRRFKDDVKEVRSGLECGIRLGGFDDVHVGDVIEAYEIEKIARTL